MKKTIDEILKFDQFIYDDFKINYNSNYIDIDYTYEIVGLKRFNHHLELPCSNNNIDKEYVEKLVFNIGLLEMVSYWKVTMSKKVLVNCGSINKEQEDFFRKIFYYGLGEFFYINNIDPDYDSFINFTFNGKTYDKDINYSGEGTMIGIGGGKDSCVSLELLKGSKDSSCFIINPKEVTLKCAQIAGFNDNSTFIVKRLIDKGLLELNEDGFFNGHTPFSAMVSFVSYLLAYLNNKKDIILSNESSANQSNVVGTKINHQYSKSYEYERDFQEYANKYLGDHIKYFSLLRPLSEYQIGLLFSKKCSNYYNVFRSCNVGSKSKEWNWCCKCAKCLFVFSLLSPHLYKDKLVGIFGTDLFEDADLLLIFQELLGKVNVKPFDCVGTFEEINYAITKTIKNLEGEKLPYLLDYYKNNYYDEEILKLNLESYYDNENSLDEYYTNIVKEALK